MLYREAKLLDENALEYVLSDETVDRYGEVIVAAGWQLRDFKNNPVALFNHDKSAVIGRWEKVRIEGTKLLGRLVLAEAGTSALVDYVRSLVAQKMLRAVSVGFRSVEKEPLKKDGDSLWGPFRYLKSELVESSLVAVPANPNALQVSRSFELLSAHERALVLGKPAAQDERATRSAHPARPPKPLAHASTPMKLSERIKAAQAELNRLRDTLTALVEKDDPTEEEQAQIEELNERIPEYVKALEKMQATERALAIQVATIEPNDEPQQRQITDNRRPFAVQGRKLTPVDYLVRSFAISLVSYLKQESPDQVRRRMYGEDESTLWFMRAAVSPAMTGVPDWAGELVQTAIADFVNLLQPVSVFPALRNRGTSFTFDRAGGIIRVPARASTQQLAGAWVGEGQPIPVRRISISAVPLFPKKLGVISSFTQEMADYSTPNIEAVIRQSMAEDTAVVIDTNLLDANPATAIRPAGLRNGVTETTVSAATEPTVAMIEDLRALIAAIIDNNGGRDIVLIMNPLQMMGINFSMTDAAGFLFPSEGEAARRFSVTFATSTTVPKGMVIAVDAADFASASGAVPEYSISNQATVHEEDTSPQPITGGTPSPAVPVRSYWQTDSIGIRMKLPLNWAMRRTGMVSWMDNVIW